MRFMTPMKASARMRGLVTPLSVEKKGGGRIIVKMMNELQIESEEKPALIAETLATLVSWSSGDERADGVFDVRLAALPGVEGLENFRTMSRAT